MSTMRWLAAALKPIEPPRRLQRGAAAAARRRQMRRADFRDRHALRGERAGHAIDQIVAIGVVIDMLELAAAAFGEMAARRRCVMRARRHRAVRVDRVARRGQRRRSGRLRSPRRRARRCGRSIASLTGIREARRAGAAIEIVGDQSRPGALRRAAVQPDAGAAPPRRRRARRRASRGDRCRQGRRPSPARRQPVARVAGDRGAAVRRGDDAVRALVDDHRARETRRRAGLLDLAALAACRRARSNSPAMRGEDRRRLRPRNALRAAFGEQRDRPGVEHQRDGPSRAPRRSKRCAFRAGNQARTEHHRTDPLVVEPVARIAGASA